MSGQYSGSVGYLGALRRAVSLVRTAPVVLKTSPEVLCFILLFCGGSGIFKFIFYFFVTRFNLIAQIGFKLDSPPAWASHVLGL